MFSFSIIISFPADEVKQHSNDNNSNRTINEVAERHNKKLNND